MYWPPGSPNTHIPHHPHPPNGGWLLEVTKGWYLIWSAISGPGPLNKPNQPQCSTTFTLFNCHHTTHRLVCYSVHFLFALVVHCHVHQSHMHIFMFQMCCSVSILCSDFKGVKFQMGFYVSNLHLFQTSLRPSIWSSTSITVFGNTLHRLFYALAPGPSNTHPPHPSPTPMRVTPQSDTPFTMLRYHSIITDPGPPSGHLWGGVSRQNAKYDFQSSLNSHNT